MQKRKEMTIDEYKRRLFFAELEKEIDEGEEQIERRRSIYIKRSYRRTGERI